ncbi:hypothetical protein [Paraburkholderia sp. GAS348]|uniref:hypothetical protein n=1 Tax=Paraburkholderia sp. GAS348 TaxID=3035132 RepID=UPI003D20F705
MQNIDKVKARLDKARATDAGQTPSAKQMALASEYHASLFSRIKELRNSIKVRAKAAA